MPRLRQHVLLAVTDPVSLRLLDGLPKTLTERGWSVDVVVGGFAPTVEGATTRVVPMRRQPTPVADLLSLLTWMRVLRRSHPSAVVVGTPKAGLLGLLAARMTRVPVRIYHLRGLRLETTSGVSTWLLTLLERLAMSAATAVVAVSPSLRDECLTRRLTDESKIIVLGRGSSNGVDLARFSPADPETRQACRSRLGLDPTLDVIGFVGRLTPSKGLSVLAQAALLARGAYPFQILLVGSEEREGYARSLLSILRVAGIPTTHVPWVEDVSQVYPAMDLLCLPSLREGFPNVVLEAAASSLPVVTTDATGCRDSVIPSVTGWIAQAGDAADLSRCLISALANDGRRRSMGKAARRFVEENFDRNRVQDNLADYLAAQVGLADARVRADEYGG